MHISHEPWLVVLSVLVAMQGAYVGLRLAAQIHDTTQRPQRALLAGSALSLGVAIWSMHFVGMLAARLPFSVDYLVFPTLLSFLVCVLVVGVGVYAATARSLTWTSLAASAAFMGLGIASMHYIGMQALHASAHMAHDPLFVVLSVLIAIAASGIALRWMAAAGKPPLFLAAAVLGLAISGMHYTAMAGMTISPHPMPGVAAPALSPDLLAIVVAIVAFIVSGLFLLVLVPERVASPEAAAQPPEPAGAEPDLADSAAAPPRPGHLPVERDRAVYLLPLGDVVAVRANAHYTYVFDGAAAHFCSLPISEVEARLTEPRFVRIHRSHIINLDHVIALKNNSDNCQIELASRGEPYIVPVSRSRTAWVKTQFGLKSRGVAS